MELKSTTETDISTKDLLVKVFAFFKMIFSKWKVWTSALLFGACLSLVKDLFVDKEMTYRSVIIFNLELGGNNNNQFGGLASTFGLFDQGGASSGELFTSQNFPTIVKSRAVLERALMKDVVVNGDTLLMINYMADSSDIAEKEWGGDLFHKPFEAAINYKFDKKDPKDFTIIENQIINTIYDKVYEATYIDGVKGAGSIMVLSALLSNELLTKKWVETVLETTEEFYVEMKTKKTREMLKIQENRLYQIESKLSSTDNRAARLALENPNVVDPRGRVLETQVQRSSTFLSNQYLTQMANIEGLKRIILEQTPIFTIMEESRLPLEQEFDTAGLDIKLGSLAAFLISIIVLVIIDTYKNLMRA